MSGVRVNELRRGSYLDSVALMRLSRELRALPGVVEAAMMMGTPANRRILRDAGLLGEESTHPGDLVIGILAADEASAQAALETARRLLDRPARGDAFHHGRVPEPFATMDRVARATCAPSAMRCSGCRTPTWRWCPYRATSPRPRRVARCAAGCT